MLQLEQIVYSVAVLWLNLQIITIIANFPHTHTPTHIPNEELHVNVGRERERWKEQALFWLLWQNSCIFWGAIMVNIQTNFRKISIYDLKKWGIIVVI